VKVCALSALYALWVSFWGVGAGFRVLGFGPEGCGPSSAGGDSPVDKAEAKQLFESQVDVLFAYMAIEEGLIWTLDKPSGETSRAWLMRRAVGSMGAV
jgi:hypothetical protein